MRTHITRWIARAAALCVLGPLCAKLGSGVRAADGSEHASFLVSESLGKGAMTLGAILAIVVVAGVVIAKFSTRREAMFNMALILGWVAWTSGRMGEVFRVTQGGFVQLAIEAGLVLVAVMVVLRISSANTNDKDSPTMVDCGGMFRGASLMAIGAAMVAAIVVVWAFGQTDLPGQSLWASFAGGIVAGLVGAMVQQSNSASAGVAVLKRRASVMSLAQLSDRDMQAKISERGSSLIPMLFGVMIAGVVAPLIGMVMPGSGGVLESIGSGSLPGWLAVSPVAWSVGALMGVPIGWGWLESTVAMQESHAQTA